jgi:hypothetical protein
MQVRTWLRVCLPCVVVCHRSQVFPCLPPGSLHDPAAKVKIPSDLRLNTSRKPDTISLPLEVACSDLKCWSPVVLVLEAMVACHVCLCCHLCDICHHLCHLSCLALGL